MNTIDDGGPAFPLHTPTWHEDVNERGAYEGRDFTMGMSMRDYFAAKAMQGICASRDEAGTLIEHGYEWISREAYRIADAMLLARLTRG